MMTEEELQRIRNRAEAQPLMVFDNMNVEERERVRLAFVDRWTLIHEVERLREYNQRLSDNSLILHREVATLLPQNAAMREIVQAVAKGPTILGIATMYLCNFCDVYVGGIFGRTDHRADCPVTKARAILEK